MSSFYFHSAGFGIRNNAENRANENQSRKQRGVHRADIVFLPLLFGLRHSAELLSALIGARVTEVAREKLEEPGKNETPLSTLVHFLKLVTEIHPSPPCSFFFFHRLQIDYLMRDRAAGKSNPIRKSEVPLKTQPSATASQLSEVQMTATAGGSPLIKC